MLVSGSMNTEQKKAAFVAIIGRPSVGKSTLINALCGQKVAIVSPVPQTTRNAIRGIVNRDEGQLVFVDTPGLHNSEKKINNKLMEVGTRTLGECDLALYVLDATRAPGIEERLAAETLKPSKKRALAIINKMDEKDAKPTACRKFLAEVLLELSEDRCLEISAKTGAGLDILLERLFQMAPVGDALYAEDYYTDQDIQFRISEIIREKAINRLTDELPHSIYIEVEDTELRDNETRLWVRAFIIVERESQKGIVVGAGGAMIKAIRQAAQKDLNKIFDWKVELDLRVKTGKDWRQKDHILRRIMDR